MENFVENLEIRVFRALSLKVFFKNYLLDYNFSASKLRLSQQQVNSIKHFPDMFKTFSIDAGVIRKMTNFEISFFLRNNHQNISPNVIFFRIWRFGERQLQPCYYIYIQCLYLFNLSPPVFVCFSWDV